MKLLQVTVALGITEDPEESKKNFDATLASDEGMASVAAAIENQAEHFDMPGLQLGFCYEEGALARGEGDAPPPFEVRRFTPSGCPGARVPHAWLAGCREGESLLDRVPLGGFLLIVGPEGQEWEDALAGVEHAPAVEVLRLDADRLPDLETWFSLAGLGPQGALLVRPDQHVGWRSSGASREPAAVLSSAFEAILQQE